LRSAAVHPASTTKGTRTRQAVLDAAIARFGAADLLGPDVTAVIEAALNPPA
jgi:hypothetical protein